MAHSGGMQEWVIQIPYSCFCSFSIPTSKRKILVTSWLFSQTPDIVLALASNTALNLVVLLDSDNSMHGKIENFLTWFLQVCVWYQFSMIHQKAVLNHLCELLDFSSKDQERPPYNR